MSQSRLQKLSIGALSSVIWPSKNNQPRSVKTFPYLPTRRALAAFGLPAAFLIGSLNAQAVDDFLLIDAAADVSLGSLADGATIDLASVGSEISIEAVTSGSVGSVVLQLSGTETNNRTESVAPYTLFGDVGTPPVDYNSWTPTPGAYTLTATPYTAAGGSGTAGTVRTINFTVTGAGGPPVSAGGEFLEIGGLVVIEAESEGVYGDWDLNTTVSGFTGSGYIEWKTGNFSTSIDGEGSDPITYEILIQNPGRYRFLLRSAAPNSTEHNDVWARFPDNTVFREKSGVFSAPVFGSDSWFKVYQNVSGNTFTYSTKHVDFDPHDIYMDFPTAGVYRFEFSGRSTRFKIDRFVIYNEDSVSFSTASNPATPESPRNVVITCNPPSNLNTEVLTTTAARLTWDLVAEADGYQFEGRAVGAPNWRQKFTNSDGGVLDVFNPGQSYEWRIRSGCAGDTSAYSPIQTFTMPTSLEGDGSVELSSYPMFRESAGWNVQPNPASVLVTLQGAQAGWTAAVLDLTGRVVVQEVLTEGRQLSLSGLADGLYYVRLHNASGEAQGQQSLVVQR